ncbi:hypothetical protein JZ751_013592 [Albula glossodonta]|uniref:Mitochondrial import inner membrane translocase subunit TIM44 n=1 Tax=Albula glossodonta TaxID=121402 RepID=A0A8T2P1A2_9TELE|nr:hypothetical protein JZ751_013592 [Albula glossodonta]
MAASLCQCYQLGLRRSLPLLSASYISTSNITQVYRICGSPRVSSQVRYMSGGGGARKGFLGEFVDTLKQELNKNKEMKENIRKFREEAKKLEDSEALRQARRKYKSIESETVKTSEVLKKRLDTLSETVKEGLEEVGRSDLGRKIKEGVEEAAKTAKQSAESVSKGSEKLGRTGAFRAISQGMETVKKEIDDLGQSGPYRAPSRLRMRTDFSSKGPGADARVFEVNEEAMGVVLHKDSKWYQQWKDFKDNNMVFNRFFEMKMKYDESDNALIRATRSVTDKVTDLIGGLFSKTEISEVLTEILRADPSFDKDSFLKQCEHDIIPNVLEAMIRGELEVLKDWCYEATYSQLAHPIQQARAMGLQFHSKILDIDNIDLAMGKLMEQGPVLIITFQAQLVMVIRNTKGDLVEGDPVSVLKNEEGWTGGVSCAVKSLGVGVGSAHPKPSRLGSGLVTVEARSSGAAPHHSPSWSNSPYTAWSVTSKAPPHHHTSSSMLHGGNQACRVHPFTFSASHKDTVEKVLRMLYVWALCRDQEELNPDAAWRLLDISASSTEQPPGTRLDQACPQTEWIRGNTCVEWINGRAGWWTPGLGARLPNQITGPHPQTADGQPAMTTGKHPPAVFILVKRADTRRAATLRGAGCGAWLFHVSSCLLITLLLHSGDCEDLCDRVLVSSGVKSRDWNII